MSSLAPGPAGRAQALPIDTSQRVRGRRPPTETGDTSRPGPGRPGRTTDGRPYQPVAVPTRGSVSDKSICIVRHCITRPRGSPCIFADTRNAKLFNFFSYGFVLLLFLTRI